MARQPRLAVAGQTHHVLQRGHGGQPVFRDDEDRQAFLLALRDAVASERVELHGYALLDDEYQLLLTPPKAEALSRLIQQVGRRYGARFNRRHERCGTLWAGRFHASIVEPDPWALRCLQYIETAQLRDGQVAASPGQLRWSSAAHHLGLQRDPLVTEHPRFWALGNTPFEREAAWRARFEQGLSTDAIQAIAGAVERGWALGSDAFLLTLGAQTLRRVSPLPRGRPPSKRAAG